MQHAPVTIDDGFGKPVNGVPATDGGNPQPEIGNKEPDRKVQSASTIAGIPVIDPLIYSDPGNDGFRHDNGSVAGSEPGKRRRGRPPGSGNKQPAAQKATPNITANLESLIVSGHIMLAKLIDWDELILDDDEARKLSDGLKEVAKHYTMEMDPKKLAWMNLSMIAGGIYGPRIISAWRENKKKEAERPREVAQPKRDTTGRTVSVEGQTVDHAAAQAWASQGVVD
jgi:hypothetical protein